MTAKCQWKTEEDQIDLSCLQELVASLLVAEDHQWFESWSPLNADASSSRSLETPGIASQQDTASVLSDPGWTLLRHGHHVRRIHTYFQNLEPHRYCLSLTARTKKLGRPNTRIKLVCGDSRVDPPPQTEQDATGQPDDQEKPLKEKDPEFELYEMAVLCSQFPVLGAPPTPSPYSPTPSPAPESPTLQRFFSFGAPPPGSGFDDSSYSPPPKWAHSAFQSPQSAGVSCVSPEPVVPVHSDMLRELVRKTFSVSKKRHMYLEKVVKDKKQPKRMERVLVEDLLTQLSLLETNHHPFYRVQSFMDKNGYSEWLIQEKEHITHLIKTFWHFSLPPMPGIPIHIPNSHEMYKELLAKLIRYESTSRVPHAVFGDVTPTSPLSPSACRLLKEFGLRYGVGELYRRLAYLHYMAVHFENEVWYIKHVTTLLENVMGLVTSPEIYVKEEFITLLYVLSLLLRQSKYSMTRIIRLFPDNSPPGAVTSLVAMSALVADAGEFLKVMFPVIFLSVREAREFVQSLDEDPFEKRLAKYLKKEMENRYERFKVIAMDELHGHCYTTTLSPRLLNILILNIRDEVNSYRLHFKHEFERYLDIVELAITTHYQFLMTDVLEMCEQPDNHKPGEVDLRMLSLAFRLSAMDQEWAKYIPLSMQTWRAPFLDLAICWMDAISQHVQDLVPAFLQAEPWSIAQIPGCNAQDPGKPKPGPSPVRPRDRSPSRTSLAHSETSAFRTPMQRRGSDSGLKKSHPTAIPSLMQRHRLTTSHPELSSSLPTKPTKLPHLQHPVYGSDTNLVRYQTGSRETHRVTTHAHVHVTSKERPGYSDKESQDRSEDITTKHGGRIANTERDRTEDINGNMNGVLSQHEGTKHIEASDRTAHIEAIGRTEHTEAVDRIEHIEAIDRTEHIEANDRTEHIEAIDRTEDIEANDHTEHIEAIDRTEHIAGGASSGDSLACVYDTATLDSTRATPYENEASSSSPSDSIHSSDSFDFIDDKWAKHTRHSAPLSGITSENSKTPIESAAEVKPGQHTSAAPSIKDNGKKDKRRAACSYVETGALVSPPCKTELRRSNEAPCNVCPVSQAGPPDIEQIADAPRVFSSSKRLSTRGLVRPRTLQPVAVDPNTQVKRIPSTKKAETDAVSSSTGSLPTDYGSCRSRSIAGSFVTAQDHISEMSDSTIGRSSTGTGYDSSHSSETSGQRRVNKTTKATMLSGMPRLVPMSSSVVDLLCCVQRLTAFTCHLSQVLCPVERPSAAADSTEVRERVLETKRTLQHKVVQVVVSLVQLYADSIISVETCGMTDEQINCVLGDRLLTRLQTEYTRAGMLTGCRHNPESRQRCNTTTITGRKVPPCEAIRTIIRSSGACEPITDQMGVRISDVLVLRHLLLWLHERVTSSLSCSGSITSHAGPELSIKSETYCQFGPSLDGQKGALSEDMTQSADDRPQGGDEVAVQSCQGELERCEIAQTTLIAYRINQYFRQVLHTLLRLSLKSFDVKKRLQPAVEFLTQRLTTLHRVLFPDNFNDLLTRLWGYVVQDFTEEAEHLKAMRSGASNHAKLLLQAIAHLMQFFCSQEQGLNLQVLSDSTDEVSKHLELYASPTARLIRMYRWFARQMFQIEPRTQRTDEFYSSASSGSHQSRAHEPSDAMIQALRSQLHATRKCFTGAQFVDWVREYVKDHGYDSLGVCIGSSDTETGLELGHFLLERNMLVCVCSRQGAAVTSAEDLECSVDSGEVSMSLRDRGRGSVLVCDQQRQGKMSVNEIAVSKRTRSTNSPNDSSHPSTSRSTSRAATLSPELLESIEDPDDRGLTDTVEAIIYRTSSQSDAMDFCNSPHVFYSFMSDEEGNGGEFKYKLAFLDRFTVGRKLQQILCVLYTRKDKDIEARLFLKRVPLSTVSEALGYEATPVCFRL